MDNSVLFHCVSIVHAYIIHKQHVIIVIRSDTVMAILSHDDGFKALQLKTKSLTKKSWKEKSLNEILISWIKKSAIDKGNSLTPMELLIKHLPG